MGAVLYYWQRAQKERLQQGWIDIIDNDIEGGNKAAEVEDDVTLTRAANKERDKTKTSTTTRKSPYNKVNDKSARKAKSAQAGKKKNEKKLKLE